MKIIVNQQSQQCQEGESLAQVLEHLSLAGTGLAVAVNGQVIARSQWPAHALEDGDTVSVFQAIAGG